MIPSPSVRSRGREVDDGSATVEFALVLPALAMILGLVLGAAGYGIAATRAQHAANVGSRVAVAAGQEAGREAAERVAGPGARAHLDSDGAWTTVEVWVPGPWGLEAHAQATSREQE